MESGLPAFNSLAIGTMFNLDPEVKEERIWPAGARKRPLMLERKGPSAWIRDTGGSFVEYPFRLMKQESVLSQIIEPHLYPEISAVRHQILHWRFYHHFRTDASSPLRQPQVGVHSPVLSHDGSDLAAALQTVIEIGDDATLQETIGAAFNGARLRIESAETLFSMRLEVPGLLRPLHAREFSDGQLRFLCLCAALLSPRPPTLLALNEPETSLHPDLIDPLAKLIVRASKDTQLWITTHSRSLAEKVEEHSGIPRVELRLWNGETIANR
jgi:predicted ATPase